MDKEKTNVRQVSFRVEGNFITDLARSKFYDEHDFPYAINLIMSCTECDAISTTDRFIQALKILNYDFKLAGTYPGPDYGVYEDPEGKADHPDAIKDYFKSLSDRFHEYEARIHSLSATIELASQIMTEEQRLEMRSELLGQELPVDNTLFPPDPTIITIPMPDGGTTSLRDALDRFHDDTDPDTDYGWLSPMGEFFPSEFGSHQASAYILAKKYYPDEVKPHMIKSELFSDLLYDHGWTLLHNPGMGTAYPTKSDTARFTKRQKEFLYDYYMKRNKPVQANKYMAAD